MVLLFCHILLKQELKDIAEASPVNMMEFLKEIKRQNVEMRNLLVEKFKLIDAIFAIVLNINR